MKLSTKEITLISVFAALHVIISRLPGIPIVGTESGHIELTVFLSETVSVHVDQCTLDERGRIDFTKVTPFVYNQGEYWSLHQKIGVRGFSKQ